MDVNSQINSALTITTGVSLSAAVSWSVTNLGKSFAVGAVNGNQSFFVRLFRSIGPSNSEYKVVQFGICSQGEATT